ncbi:MAG: ribose-phosphate pyrophosphokinase [Pyrobaculum sp.]
MDILYFLNALDIAYELKDLGELKQIEERVFPDGEVIVRLPDVGREAVVVARLYPAVNDNLVKLILTLDALNDLGVGKVTLVIPYMPYARQDRRFRPGEPISAKTILKLLSHYSVANIITIDLHKPHVVEYTTMIKVMNIYPAAEFIKTISEIDVVLSPDFGSIHRARAIAEVVKKPYTFFEKYRDRESGAVTLVPRIDVELRGKKVLLVDDILSTGGTLVEACGAARRLGADVVYAAVTHCQMLKDAKEKIKSCIDRLVCTDTVLNEYAEVKTAPLIRKELERLL